MALWAGVCHGAGSALGPVKGLPREFEAHFFDVPLAVRVDLDGRYLGDAMVVLSRDQRVQLLEFTETFDSREPESLRRLWRERLVDGRPLGDCQAACPDGLRAIHYSLANSQLSLLTDRAEAVATAERFHRLPEQGSHGLLLRNQLNLVNDGVATSGRYALQGQGSVGHRGRAVSASGRRWLTASSTAAATAARAPVTGSTSCMASAWSRTISTAWGTSPPVPKASPANPG